MMSPRSSNRQVLTSNQAKEEMMNLHQDCEEEQEEINRIIHFLKGPNIPCPDRAVFRSLKMEELFTENGILYLQPNKQVLTSNQATEEMKNLHQGPEVSHFGYERTYAAFWDVYYHS